MTSVPEEMNFEFLMSPPIGYMLQNTTSPPLLLPRANENAPVYVPSVECQPNLFLPTLSDESTSDEIDQSNTRLLARLSSFTSKSVWEFSRVAMAIEENDGVDHELSDVRSHHDPVSTPRDICLDATFSFSDDGDGSIEGLPHFPDLEEISSDSEMSSDDSVVEGGSFSIQLRPRLPSNIELNRFEFFDL